ncbi:MAG: chorismate synthase [Candidatus Zixiibacteriota bacterium]
MLTYLTSGESHGPRLTAIIDGFPAGFEVYVEKLNFQLNRRRLGYGRGARMKIEPDKVAIVSGLRHGKTLGSPITLVIENRDWENWAKIMSSERFDEADSNSRITRPRPGHADLCGAIKYDHRDIRNVLERASARDTAARTAIGALARQLLEYFHIRFASHVVRIGDVVITDFQDIHDLDEVIERTEKSTVRCLDKQAGAAMVAAIDRARKNNDTLGGMVEVIIRGLPVGLGGYSQGKDRLGALLAGAMMSIPSVKGVEIGLGFAAAEMNGSEIHDEIFYDPDRANSPNKGFYRKTNRAGGLEGGMTNGEDIVLRLAAKPIATLKEPLATVDIESKKPTEAVVERADTCVVPAVGVIAENLAAMVLADAFLKKFGSDNMREIENNYKAFLNYIF